jgi:hypothetical protein
MINPTYWKFLVLYVKEKDAQKYAKKIVTECSTKNAMIATKMERLHRVVFKFHN